MEVHIKCQFAPCDCIISGSEPFCSVDCEQASSQSVERQFCQCTHAGCCMENQQRLTVDATGLRDSFHFFARGQVTLEYDSRENLIQQLTDLITALSDLVPKDLDRRPAASLLSGRLAKSQSA